MSRQLEQMHEDRRKKKDKLLLLAVGGGLEAGVERSGGVLTGLTIKISGLDCLMVVKAELPAGQCVAFVGAEDMEAAFRKAYQAALRDELAWRKDKFTQNSRGGK